MIEWLLTDSNLFTATIFGVIGTIALFAIITVSLPYEKKPKTYERIGDFCIIGIFLVPVIIIFIGLSIASTTQVEYTSNSEWKTIYENNIDAEIILNLKTENGYLISNAIGGKTIGTDYKDYTRDSNMNGTILAKKDDLEEKKTIHINNSDIIYNSELTPTSKITKIEYKPAEKKYKTLFGHKGKESDADIDGLVRITISDDNSPERTALQSLFTN
jgi:hypothetical protein